MFQILLATLVLAAAPVDPCDKLLAGNQIDKAETCYAGRVKRDRKDYEAHNALAGIHFSRGHFDKALAAFDTALALRPQNGVALNGRAMSLLGLGREKEGFKALELAISTDPTNLQAVNNFALLAFGSGKLQAAEETWQFALKVQPDDVDANIGMGEVRIRQNRFPEAIEFFEIAVKRDPTNARAYWMLGKIVSQKDPASAVPLLERAVSFAPKDPAVLYDLGLVLFASGNVQRAGGAFAEALKIAPHESALYYSVGKCYLAESQNSDALKLFREALRFNPGRALAARIHLHTGIAQERLGNPRDAGDSYREALRVEPTFASARVNLGAVQFGFKKYEEAVKEFEAALAAEPDMAEARMGIYLSRLNQKRKEEADQELARLRELPANHPVRVRAEEIAAGNLGGAQPRGATGVPEKPELGAPATGKPAPSR